MSVDARGFELNCGLRIDLCELEQKRVYEGLLEGLPTRERNERYLRELVEQARSASGHVPVTVLPPEAKPIETREPYPFGKPESLPGVVCIGRFRAERCTPAADDPADHYSELVIIWFQDDFSVSVPDGIERGIRRIDWDGLAGNFGD
jgi:hypothetical protein